MVKRKIRVMMIEDHPEYREVIEIALLDESDMELCGRFGAAESALRSLQNMQQRKEPDIVLLDLNLPGMSGIDAIPHLSKSIPDSKIIILTQSDREKDIVKTITLGAAGYLLKSASVKEIKEGIRTVMNGGASLDAGVATSILSMLKAAPPKEEEEKTSPLSNREMEILTMIANGQSQKEIADQLGIGIATVVTHIGRIYKKLNVVNAPAAINKAHILGLLQKKQ